MPLSAEEQKERFQNFEIKPRTRYTKRLVQGVGINDSDYQTQFRKGGSMESCLVYRRWTDLLVRCYSKKFKEKSPTYRDVTVCEEWKRFSNFRKWMLCQDWYGKHLDKDILVKNNKVYSPETCIFVPQYVNALLTDAGARRGSYPIGVSYNIGHRCFCACCAVDGKNVNLGDYSTPEAAHEAYLEFKSKRVMEIALEQDNDHLKQGLVRISNEIATGEYYARAS